MNLLQLLRRATALALLALLSTFALAACGDSSGDDASDDGDATEDSAEGESDDTSSDDSEADDDAEATDTDATDDDAEAADTDDGDDGGAEATGSSNVAEVVAAADALIALLSDDEAAAMMYDFGDASITSGWSNLPACTDSDRGVDRNGVQMGAMSEEQQTATLALAATMLSEDGLAEVADVRIADDYLQDSLGNTIWDSDCYSMAIFGTPSETEAFAVQFGGHHLARMATYEGDTVTVTPSFTGIEPGTFEVDGTSYDVMGDEMSAVYGVFTALDETQQATAEISNGDGILMGPGSDDPFPDSEGLSVSELSDDQKTMVLDAMRPFVEDFDSSVAETLMAEYESELDETTLAWATGVDTETSGAYARIDGPSIWIEVSNEDGATGIHFHGIYRDKADDYGTAA